MHTDLTSHTVSMLEALVESIVTVSIFLSNLVPRARTTDPGSAPQDESYFTAVVPGNSVVSLSPHPSKKDDRRYAIDARSEHR